MRMMRKDLREVTFRQRVSAQDVDGTTYATWSDDVVTLLVNVQPSGGSVSAAQYGDRLRYSLTAYTNQWVEQLESAGAWVYVDPLTAEPDYKVVAVKRYTHTVIELEKVSP